MKNLSKVVIVFCSFCTLLFSACGNGSQPETTDQLAAEAPAKTVAPTEIFANNYVSVVKVSLAPGEETAVHEGNDRVIYSLGDYTIDWQEKGRDQGTKSWKKGAVHFHEAGPHSAKNNGTTQAEWLAFVRTSAELPDCSDYSLENDVNAVAADFATQLFDNEAFRLTEVVLPPGARIPMHSGINRLIYSLSDYQIQYESDKEGKGEKTFRTGDVHWHEGCEHALENIGQGEAHFLVVAYKKM
ncbi:MAG: hypothetical protein R2824_24940 [Saprospiraceae bacterium]|nr:hypothetical protein [Lewinella sp.]